MVDLRVADPTWRPSASQSARVARAEMLARVRAHFAAQQVLEVETPLLSHAGTTDPNIGSARVRCGAIDGYLQTSPEFAMKRLLADGCGDCYQIARVFRAGERGARHNPEFSLLEWYRVGFSLADLVDDTLAVLEAALGKAMPATQLSFAGACRERGGFDPIDADVEAMRAALTAAGAALPVGLGDDEVDGWIDLAFSTLVASTFAADAVTVVSGYPASQASLAKVVEGDAGPVALRAEVYVGALELGNGFEELLDADEQLERFQSERAARLAAGRDAPPVDQHLIAALRAGMPACSGMALGLDRVLMVALGETDIDAVLNFPWGRA
ncbi:MAG: EF-P lysine aminoacylase EpmA [Pseudomonadota bacterium]